MNYDVNESSTEEEGSSSEDVIDSFSENESDDRSRLKPSIGDVVVVVYEVKKKTLRFLGLVQQIESENVTVQYLKRSGEKTFSLKDGDIDTITSEKIITVIKVGNFFVNSRGQYIFNVVLPVLSM